MSDSIDWDYYETRQLELRQIRDWVQYWHFEEELADEIYDHIRLALYKMQIVRANMQLDDGSLPDWRDN